MFFYHGVFSSQLLSSGDWIFLWVLFSGLVYHRKVSLVVRELGIGSSLLSVLVFALYVESEKRVCCPTIAPGFFGSFCHPWPRSQLALGFVRTRESERDPVESFGTSSHLWAPGVRFVPCCYCGSKEIAELTFHASELSPS
ncbi:hypothetical protein MPNT_170031 [Candidatus Methylacidithermus pantelleriae]|uniref:Uncharacterized protein n=1 Tax=Candidatus Methylacidithermus pantelleriae TaxID=2744239 RepID=A0A8J2BIQ6_9BACT|nr:hypothetical protein MPNT_170031 [Candidatus Methylacidithermus pantelleriae]